MGWQAGRRAGHSPPGFIATVIGFRSVLVHLDLKVAQFGVIEAWIIDVASHLAVGEMGGTARRVDIPVTFDGPDLDAVAVLHPLGEPAAMAGLAAVDVLEAQHHERLARVRSGDGGERRQDL